MKVQRIGPDSLLLVLDRTELPEGTDLRQQAAAALRQEGIAPAEEPELTAYTAGCQTLVFVQACAHGTTYFGFEQAEDLLDAAREAGRLFPDAPAQLIRKAGRFYLVTAFAPAAELLREYAWDIRAESAIDRAAEVLIPANAFEILSGR